MTIVHLLAGPFADYAFMRRALVACAALALGGAPLGVFLVLRRMALVGDAISHAILPGAAIAFLCFGLSLPAMTAGGLVAGLAIALIAGTLTRFTQLKEDASFSGTYLVSLSAGVLIISLRGSTVDLMHVLFGNVLAIDNASLRIVCAVATISALLLAALYRNLIALCFDPDFLRAAGGRSTAVELLFLVLVVLNLVAAFQALGTLMALGVMVLPAIAARFWARGIDGTILFSIAASFISSYAGLLISYYASVPSGPAIVMTAGGICAASVLFGRLGSVAARFLPHRHFAS